MQETSFNLKSESILSMLQSAAHILFYTITTLELYIISRTPLSIFVRELCEVILVPIATGAQLVRTLYLLPRDL
jgi:hypothetical protein